MAVQDKAYLEQIDKYYRKKLSSHSVIELGMTPEVLVKFGAPKLPLIILEVEVLMNCHEILSKLYQSR